MQIGCVSKGNQRRFVALSENSWHDVTGGFRNLQPTIRSIAQLIRSGRCSTSLLEEICRNSPAIEAPRCFELPLVPSKVVCIGRNYADHARELGNTVPDEPVLFNKTPNTYLPDGGTIAIDPALGRVEHEGEIALVIGPQCKVAGYTLLNDVTARDLQSADKAKGLPWFRAKNLDTFCPFGPVIRLADSLPESPELDIELRVNGQLRQKGNTREFIFPIERMLDYISRFVTLGPGDLVATGTPSGTGRIEAGDRIEVSCAEIGILRSQVAIKR